MFQRLSARIRQIRPQSAPATTAATRANSLENPSVSVAEYVVGIPAKSGANVNYQTSLTVTAFWRAINILAGVIASMPLDVYEVDDDDNATKRRRHPVSRVLRKSPNYYITKFDFMQTLVTHLSVTGNFYGRIDRDVATGYVRQIYPLAPERVKMRKNERSQPTYVFTKEDGSEVTYSYDRILHVSGLAWNELKGLDVVDTFKDVLGTALSNQDYIATFYENGAMLSGVVTVPQKLTDEAYKRLSSSWNSTYGGATNAGKTAILEQGATYAKTGSTPAEAGYSETKKAILSDVARITGVPQFLLEDLDRATFNNIEHLGTLFVNYTVMPLCQNIAEEFSRKLLPDMEQDTHEIRFDYSALTKADAEARAKEIDALMKWGIINRDEARKMQGMNPITDGSGQTYYVPMNMVDPTQEPAATASTGAAPSIGAGGQRILTPN